MPVPLRDNIFQEKKEYLAKNLVLILIFKLLIVLSQNFLVFYSTTFIEIAHRRTVVLNLGVMGNLLKL